MQLANAIVAIGPDGLSSVPKYHVTPGEVAVLVAIHGEGAVTEIEILEETTKRSNREERERLIGAYGRAKDGEDKPIVVQMFPGAAARVFETFDELGLEDICFKEAPRARKAPAPVKAVGGMTKAELLAYAKAKGIEVDAGSKKDDILQAILPPEEEAEDEDDAAIGDMPEVGNVMG
jgi:hypothetical protein